MNANEFDALADRLLPSASRRRFSTMVVGLAVALGVVPRAPFSADALKKKKNKKKGNKKKPPAKTSGCTPACTGMRVCINGLCTLGCGPEMAECSGEDFCVDLDTDAHHCGACGRSCSGGDVCLEGVCTCLPPFVDLSTVLHRARPGATVRLCAGTWDLSDALTLPSFVDTIIGAGNGDGGSTLRGKAMRRAVVNLSNSNIKLKQLRITHSTSGDRETVYNEGTLTLDNVSIEDTGSDAIRNTGRLTMDQCNVRRSARVGLSCGFQARTEILRSVVSGNGQGIENYGDITLHDCEVSDNHAPIERGISGGGIYHNQGELILSGTTAIRGNSAEWGAGITNSSGSISVGASCEISGNTASVHGGGIENYEGTIAVATGARITGNSAQYGAGIINRNGSILGDISGLNANMPDDYCEFDEATWSCI